MNQPAMQSKSTNDRWVSIALLVLAAIFTWLLMQLANFPELARPLIFVAVCLAMPLRQRWLIYLVAVAVLFAATHQWRREYGIVLLPRDIYLVVVLMGFLIFTLRVTDLPFRVHWWPDSKKEPADDPDRLNTWQAVRPISSGLLLVPLSLAAAVFVLWIIPYDPSTDYEWEITPTGFRAISILWLLSVIWFIASGVFWWVAERNNDPVRAGVLARSIFCRQLNRELHGIEKRRARRLQKQSEE